MPPHRIRSLGISVLVLVMISLASAQPVRRGPRGKVRVMAMDPMHVMELVRKPEAVAVSIEVKEKLEAVIAEL